MKTFFRAWVSRANLVLAVAASITMVGACSSRDFNPADSNAASVSGPEAFAYGAPGKDPAYDEYEKKLKSKPSKGF